MTYSYRPRYHASVTSGWSNDPNGFIYYNGRIHLFFQHYPHKSEWGTMHWGHIVTDDFVKWEDLPITLVPDNDYEEICGCCSGSTIMKDGKMYLMYTAAQPTLQRQCLAVSDDGINFEKEKDNPILTAAMLSEEVSPLDFRDPKMFEKDGYYYFIAGVRILKPGMSPSYSTLSAMKIEEDIRSGKAKPKSPSILDVSGAGPDNPGDGNLILARSRDLLNWEYVGKLIYPTDWMEDDYFNLNGVYECPDYFTLDGSEVLLSSPQNLPEIGGLYQNIHSSIYMTGKLDYESGKFEIENVSELDRGFDFYAAQTMQMPDGRRIMTAWKEMWDRNYPTQEEGWAGTYILPRELEVKDGVLYQHPVREIEKYRSDPVSVEGFEIAGGSISPGGFRGTAAEIEFILEPNGAKRSGVKLFSGRTHETLVYYDTERNAVVFDRSNSGRLLTGREENVVQRICQVDGSETLKLRIFLDVSSIEVFINDGQYVMSGNVYPDRDDDLIEFFSEGGKASFKNIKKYDIIA